MASHGAPSRGRDRSWNSHGWVTRRWLLIGVCTVGVICAGSAWVGGVLLLIYHPPPLAVWLLALGCGVVEMWCWRTADADADEFGPDDVEWEFDQA